MVSNLFSVIYIKGRDHALTKIDNDMQQSKTNKQSINLSDDSRTLGYETALEIYHSCVCACAYVVVNEAARLHKMMTPPCQHGASKTKKLTNKIIKSKRKAIC